MIKDLANFNKIIAHLKQIRFLRKMLMKRTKYPILVIIIITVLLISNGLFQNFSFAISPNECKVLKIYDGDTMTLQCQSAKVKVRLYCIDTPEMRQKPWGTQARDYLRSITPQSVRLVKIDKDRYGRIVGEVYSGDINLNLAQVEAGKAAVYNTYCKKQEYKEAENKAKEAKKGIWSQSGLHQKPWIWRRRSRN